MSLFAGSTTDGLLAIEPPADSPDIVRLRQQHAAVLLWICAGVLAAVAVATSGNCRDSAAPLLIIGSGIASTGAAFLLLNRRRRLSVALFLALVIGGVITGVLLVIGIGRWVGNCTA